VIDSPAHRAVALEAARKAIVLLQNRGRLLPLDKAALKRMAVIGPLADQIVKDIRHHDRSGTRDAGSEVVEAVRPSGGTGQGGLRGEPACRRHRNERRSARRAVAEGEHSRDTPGMVAGRRRRSCHRGCPVRGRQSGRAPAPHGLCVPVPATKLAYWDETARAFVTEPGDYGVLVGASSEDVRAESRFGVSAPK